MFRWFFHLKLLMACIISTAGTAVAQVVVAKAFSHNMVLQRNKAVPVWGMAPAGQIITVHFSGQRQQTIADIAGKWNVVLHEMKAQTVPQHMVISAGNDTLRLENILVGDVWLCSGQSNMEYPLDRILKKYAAPKNGIDEGEIALTEAKPAAIRYLYIEKDLKQIPLLPTKGWTDGNDTIVRYVSAIGYFFAKEVHAKTGVPIGIISNSWGGTRIEQWQPDWSYGQSRVFKDSATAPNFKIDGIHPGQMYNGMIAPLLPFAIKGVLWYQGESNAIVEDQQTYPAKFELLVNTWRNLFNNTAMPFYYVQIAPYLYSARKDKKQHSTTLLPVFWAAQEKCLRIKNTGMVLTTDLVDNLKDIHPSYKWIIGRRLAALALEKDYQVKQTVLSGPVFKWAKRKKSTLVLTFKNTGSGLKSSDGKELTWFAIAGKDKKFVSATAVITGSSVLLTAPGITKPVYVRFAWDEKAQPNFVNNEGLPAMPFNNEN